MEVQGLEGVGLGGNLRMVQPVERPEGYGQLLNANFGTGGRAVSGLGLGVGRRHISESRGESMRAPQERERGDPVAWRLLLGNAGGITEVLPVEGRTDHIEPSMAMMIESAVSQQEAEASECEGQRKERTELSGREQIDIWRMENVEGFQVIDERGTSGRIGMGSERWRPESRGLKSQGWYKQGFRGRGIGEQEINVSAAKTDDSALQVLYRECNRNLAVGKGTSVLDGCGEFMEGIADPLRCAACSCHRNFHRRIVLGREELDWERREREARELEESLSTIHKIAGDIKSGARRAIPLLSQEQQRLGMRDLSSQNHAALFKSCTKALGQVANSMLAIADCLAVLQHSNGMYTVAPQNRGSIETCKGLPALVPSSDVSPVNKSEPKLGSPTAVPQVSPSTLFPTPMISWQGSTILCASDRAPFTPVTESGYNEQKQKRKRTRFTFEQIKKLNDFAARIGWTLAGVSKEEIDAVCTDLDIESVTLKYWIHNTRQKSKVKQEDDEKTPPGTP